MTDVVDPRVVLTVQASDLWLTAEDAGKLFGCEARAFRERVARVSGCPVPARIGGTGAPRWNMGELLLWRARGKRLRERRPIEHGLQQDARIQQLEKNARSLL